MDKDDLKEVSQTCHLCGKIQCGQRLGRVTCCRCSRIFCLQQLNRKFHIIAVANDPNFVCPRCQGICCCVCNCQKPPPHVHCKVYKVRQNKMHKTAADNSLHETTAYLPETHPTPPIDDVPYGNRTYPHDMSYSRIDGLSNSWSESQSLWPLASMEIPGILIQPNLKNSPK